MMLIFALHSLISFLCLSILNAVYDLDFVSQLLPSVGMVQAQSKVAWTLLSDDIAGSDTHPERRRNTILNYCEGIDKAVVFAGFNDVLSSTKYDYPQPNMILKDAWLFSFTPELKWTLINPTSLDSNSPVARAEHASAILPSSLVKYLDSDDRTCHVLIHGGFTVNIYGNSDNREYLSDLWVLSITPPSYNSTSYRYSYAKPAIFGSAPSQRAGHSMVTIGSDIYMLGGYSSVGGYGVLYGEVYKLNIIGQKLSQDHYYSFNASWSKVVIDGSAQPDARAHAIVVSDPSSKSIVMVGGEADKTLADAWVFDTTKSKWSRATGNEIRNSQSAGVMYQGNLLWFAGSYIEGMQSYIKTYVYRDSGFSSVSLVKSSGASAETLTLGCSDSGLNIKSLWCVLSYDDRKSPGARFGHSAIVRNDEMIVFGGDFNAVHSDLWSVNIPLVLSNGKIYSPTTSSSSMYFAFATVLFVMFTITILILRARKRMLDRRYSMANPRPQMEIIPGVPKHMIDALPTIPYRKGMKPDVHQLFSAEALNAVPKENPEATDAAAEAAATSGATSGPGAEPGVTVNTGEANEAKVDAKVEVDGDVCPICLGDLEEGEPMKVLPCAHYFHPSCIDEWLVAHNSCPMCKRKVVKDVLAPVQTQTPATQANSVAVVISPQNIPVPQISVDAAPGTETITQSNNNQAQTSTAPTSTTMNNSAESNSVVIELQPMNSNANDNNTTNSNTNNNNNNNQ